MAFDKALLMNSEEKATVRMGVYSFITTILYKYNYSCF